MIYTTDRSEKKRVTFLLISHYLSHFSTVVYSSLASTSTIRESFNTTQRHRWHLAKVALPLFLETCSNVLSSIPRSVLSALICSSKCIFRGVQAPSGTRVRKTILLHQFQRTEHDINFATPSHPSPPLFSCVVFLPPL